MKLELPFCDFITKAISIFSLFLLTFLAGCNSSHSSGNLKRAIVQSYNVQSFPKIFETAYFNGTTIKSDSFSFNFYPVVIGDLVVESGKIIAGDPVTIHDGVAYTQNFPKGKFPVQLAIAKANGDERVAFSRILFSNDSVARWQYALQPQQKPIELTDTTFYCYGVDAGIGMFIDEAANKAFSKKNLLVQLKVLFSDMEKNSRNTWSYIVYDFDGHSLAAFSTGYGDGCYATYIGFIAKGEVCRLLTDFGLIEWWKKDTTL